MRKKCKESGQAKLVVTCANIYNNIDIFKHSQGTDALEYNAIECEWMNIHKKQ